MCWPAVDTLKSMEIPTLWKYFWSLFVHLMANCYVIHHGSKRLYCTVGDESRCEKTLPGFPNMLDAKHAV